MHAPIFARARRRFLAPAALGLLCGCGDGPHRPAIEGLVRIDTSTLPTASTGASYDVRLQAVAPHGPPTWRLRGGQLPVGVTLDGDAGTLTGWPRRAVLARFTLEARDGADETRDLDVAFAAARRSFELDVRPGPVALLPFEVPVSQVNAPFHHAIEAVGGTPPYAFALAGGTLPTGLALAPDGVLSGSPTEARSPYQPRVRVTDAAGGAAEQVYELRVVVLPLGIASGTLPDAARGFPYDRGLAVSPEGGGPPFRWTARPAASALPPGLLLEAETGRLGGAATTTGTYAFRLEVTDAVGQVAGRDVTLRVNPGPVLESVTPTVRRTDGGPITLRGQAFQPGMTALVGGGLPVEANVLDATTATVVVPPGLVASGLVSIRVTNPDGGTYVKENALRFPFTTVTFTYLGVVGSQASIGSSRGIAAGDLDGDGRADLVQVGSVGIQTIRVTGPKDAPVFQSTTVRTSGSFDDVRLADVDADGDLDLVAFRSASTETIETYRNDGHGVFPSTASATTTVPKPSSFHFPSSLAVGDVDHDGVVDVAATSGRGGQGVLWLFRGLGHGTFVLLHEAKDTVHDDAWGCFAPNGVALADLDGDGRDDVVVTDAFPSACTTGQSCPDTDGPNSYPGADDVVAWVALAGPTGAPTSWRPVRVTGRYGRLDGDNLGVTAYDHDGDGRVDLAVFGGFRDVRGMGVSFVTGDGHGAFTERYTRPTAYDRRYGAHLDADGDECGYVVVVGSDGKAGAFGAQGYSVAEVYLGGRGEVPVRAWTTGPELTVDGIPGANPGRVVVGDFDGDGRDDFAVDQSFNTKERFSNDQDDGSPRGIAVYLNRSH